MSSPFDGIYGGLTATSGLADKPLTVEDILAAAELVKNLPKPKWLLIAPDGRCWADEDPGKFGHIVLQHCYNPFTPSL